MPSDATLNLIILITLVGFTALSFVLLYPVYRFLRRQERMADDWTPEALARHAHGDGGPDEPPTPSDGAPPPRPD